MIGDQIIKVASFNSSKNVALFVTGIEIFKVVISVESSKDAVNVIPEFSSMPLAVTLVDSGTIESSRSDVNNTAQRMATNTRSHSRVLRQSRKPISSRVSRALSSSGSSPSVISET